MPRSYRGAGVAWEVDTDRLSRILRNLPGNRRLAVKKTALRVETYAKLKAPVDTGALSSSIYMWMGDEAAQLPAVEGDAERVALPKPVDADTAHVGPSVEYGLYVELGTERMGAQPYLLPAVNQAADELVRDWRTVVTDE